MRNPSQRDAFWDRIYELAREDSDIVLVIADMGAPALDKFRTDLSGQYVDVGIAEQQAIVLAAGLALSGKKVFAYAIAPFITLRCYEQIRVDLASMNLPVTLVGVGAGVSYEESGPTHHAVDDLSALRILPNLTIHNMTDSVMARAFADISCTMEGPNYVRLDRETLPALYKKTADFTHGLTVLARGSDLCIVATGNMVHRALALRRTLKDEGVKAGVIDLFTLPIPEAPFIEGIGKAKRIVTLEEHTLPGGLGGAVCEVLADRGILKPVKRFGMDFRTGYCYRYGGRERIQQLYGLDEETILKSILSP